MPRRNNREPHVPLDLTPPAPELEAFRPGRSPRHLNPLERAATEEARAHRQQMARINAGIDWSVCLVPGCGFPIADWNDADRLAYRRNPEDNLPMCRMHAVIVWQQVQRFRMLPDIVETAEQLSERHRAEAAAHRQNPPREADPTGELYFVRINDLVKVGWTKTLPRRLKEYGAGAELLCHYPGKLSDETRLHRRLNAVRAKGREWYHDGPVIQRYVDQALEEHGPPTAKAAWTVPKNPVTLRQA